MEKEDGVLRIFQEYILGTIYMERLKYLIDGVNIYRFMTRMEILLKAQ